MGCDDIFKKSRLRKNKQNKKREKPRILIVCEGERTEPLYFEAFKPANIIVRGTGFNTDSLVKKAISLRDDDALGFDQVWCVFDKDSFPSSNFNKAFELARMNNIRIAHSNEAFELWYILHFNYLDTGITREQYNEKLNKELSKITGCKYTKNDSRMYDNLLQRQPLAIKRAKKLMEKYEPNHDPNGDKPSTTVHLLVEELNKWMS